MKLRLLFLIGSILTVIPGVFAQGPGAPESGFTIAVPAAEPANRTMAYHATGVAGAKGNLVFLSSGFGFDGTVVKGAPYSAEAVTESTQRLADGNRISRKTSSKIYRDSEGRTRREETIGSIGPWAANNSEPLQSVFINDPVNKVNLVLDARNKTAQKMPTPEIMPLPGSAINGAPGGPMTVTGSMVQPDVIKSRVAVRTFEMRTAAAGGGVITSSVALADRARSGEPDAGPVGGDTTKTESLGSQVIEGVRADGTRTTVTIPAGDVGNERPIEIVSERWYSPELQTVIKSTHNDPRMEETVYRLININRTEPPQSLFVAPADYTVTDNLMQMKLLEEKKALMRSKE